jgi:hypothetical protein
MQPGGKENSSGPLPLFRVTVLVWENACSPLLALLCVSHLNCPPASAAMPALFRYFLIFSRRKRV